MAAQQAKIMEKLINHGMTNGQARVCCAIFNGETSQEAGEALGITEKCVKFHLTNIYREQKLRNRAALIIWLHKNVG